MNIIKMLLFILYMFRNSYWPATVYFLSFCADRDIHFTLLLLWPFGELHKTLFFGMSVVCSSTKMSHGQHLWILMELHKNGDWSFQNHRQTLLVISCNILLAFARWAIAEWCNLCFILGELQKKAHELNHGSAGWPHPSGVAGSRHRVLAV